MEAQAGNVTGPNLRNRARKRWKMARDHILNHLADLKAAVGEHVSFGRPKEKSIIALEIDADHVKLAEFKKTPAGLKWVRLVVKKISLYAEEEAGRIIGDLLNRPQYRRARLVVSLPRDSVMMRRVLLPSIKEDEIEKMTVYQALRYVPYGEDEITVDFDIIRRREDGFSEVTLVVAHNDVVNRHLEPIRRANLQVESLRLDSRAIFASYISSPESQKHPENQTAALVDIGYSRTNILIFRGRELIYSRSVAVGSSQISEEGEKGKRRGELLRELANTLAVHSKSRVDAGVSEIMLTGASCPRLLEEIEKRLGVPTKSLDLTTAVRMEESLSEELKRWSREFSFSTTLGLALEKADAGINLLPPALKSRRKKEARRRELAKTGILLLCVLTLAMALFYKKIDGKEEYRDSLDEKLEFVAPLVEDLETMRREIAIIQRQLDTANSVLDVLRELYQIFPSQVSLSMFSFEAGKKAMLKGSSPTMADALDLIPQLEKSTLFSKVTVQYLNKRRVEGKEVVDFLLQLRLDAEEVR